MEVVEDFTQFKPFLVNQLIIGLPGVLAQNKMTPIVRPTAAEIRKTSEYRESAVLLLFYPINNVPYLVFILRQSYEGIHSAQVAFPGGKRELFDTDLKATVLRESNEELLIIPEKVDIIGQLTDVYVPPSKFIISPFIGFVDSRPNFVKDDYEVAEIIEVAVNDILNPKFCDNTIIRRGKESIKMPCFTFNGKVVWGATAMIVEELKETLIQHSS